VVHLSDLHFGRADQELIGPLIETVHELRPNLVAVSGDLTQRARASQFRQARAFLKSLPCPQIVVPGNHDVPLHNVLARFTSPLERYRRYITDDLRPFYIDDEVALLGINSARSLTIKGGRIRREQLDWICDKLESLGREVVKLIVTHHPFEVPEGARSLTVDVSFSPAICTSAGSNRPPCGSI
jgi:3',5'-cyclic AMP phosphodiesterase CpdA